MQRIIVVGFLVCLVTLWFSPHTLAQGTITAPKDADAAKKTAGPPKKLFTRQKKKDTAELELEQQAAVKALLDSIESRIDPKIKTVKQQLQDARDSMKLAKFIADSTEYALKAKADTLRSTVIVKAASIKALESIITRTVPVGDPPVDSVAQVLPRWQPPSEGDSAQKARWANVRTLLRKEKTQFTLNNRSAAHDDSITTYQVNLKRKANVIGLGATSFGDKNLNYCFGILNGIELTAFKVDCNSGGFKNRFAWGDGPTLEHAGKNNNNTFLTFSLSGGRDIGIFLKNYYVRASFISNACTRIGNSGAKSMIIDFAGLHYTYDDAFVAFIKELSDTLRRISPPTSLYIIVPAIDTEGAYQVAALNEYADKFIIDFTSARPTKMAEIPFNTNSRHSFVNCIESFLDKNIDPAKIIAGISNHGAVWDNTPPLKKMVFINQIPYSEIINDYENEVVFDELSGKAKVDLVDENNKITGQIWFDNLQSIALKYDYVIQKQLGGIALMNMGDFSSYEPMWPVLGGMTFSLDTVQIAVTTVHADKLSFWEKVFGTAKLQEQIQYSLEVKKGEYIMPEYLSYFVFVLFSVLVTLVIIYYYMITKWDALWTGKKLYTVVLFIWSLIVLVAAIYYTFLNPEFAVGIYYDDAPKPMDFYDIVFVMLGGIVVGVLYMSFFGRALFERDRP